MQDQGWGDCQRTPLPGDASARRYERLKRGRERALLMDAPPHGDNAPCPPDASAKERKKEGYNAIARLAGQDCRAFAAVSMALGARGFSAPSILGADYQNGLMLIEDLGPAMVSNTIDADITLETQLYTAATDTLAALARCSFDTSLPAGKPMWTVCPYDDLALVGETQLLLDWYAPHFGHAVSAPARAAIDAAWRAVFEMLGALAPVLVLRDFHADNLIWMPERGPIANIGLLDFQDAVFGSPAYDLVSMLQDARRTVSPALQTQLVQRFFERAKLTDRTAFDNSYAILGAQRSAKIMGIFVRLAKRDGKARYLDFLPRATGYFLQSLAHPALAPVRQAFARHMPALLEQKVS